MAVETRVISHCRQSIHKGLLRSGDLKSPVGHSLVYLKIVAFFFISLVCRLFCLISLPSLSLSLSPLSLPSLSPLSLSPLSLPFYLPISLLPSPSHKYLYLLTVFIYFHPSLSLSPSYSSFPSSFPSSSSSSSSFLSLFISLFFTPPPPSFSPLSP